MNIRRHSKSTSSVKLPVIDSAKCVWCDACYEICPHSAIEKVPNPVCDKCIKYCISMPVPCNREIYIFQYERCDSCGHCISACRFDAIHLE